MSIKQLRDPVSSLTHLISAGIAAIAILVLLIVLRGNLIGQVAVGIYGIGLVGLFSASGIYHGYTGNADTLLKLRKWDHSAIYILIAGTYTPICLLVLTGFWRWGLLSIIWGMALAGIIVKLFIINAPRWITAGVYLLMGWISIFAVREMTLAMDWSVLAWLLIGGVFYTVGAIIYITKRMDFKPNVFGFHEVWHLFVMLGAFSHYIFIARVMMLG